MKILNNSKSLSSEIPRLIVVPFMKDDKSANYEGVSEDFIEAFLLSDFQTVTTLGRGEDIILMTKIDNNPSADHQLKSGRKLSATEVKDSSVTLDLVNISDPSIQESFLFGFLTGLYNYDKKNSTRGAEVILKNFSDKEEDLKFLEHFVAAQFHMMDLINHPANILDPENFADLVSKSGSDLGLKVRILEKEELQDLGMHAFLSVNRGSAHPPKFVIVEHLGDRFQKGHMVGFVGKSVTFDTGGISMKGVTNMHYMKSDMGGAALLWAILKLCALQKFPANIVGIFPMTDNAVDKRATLPGSVVSSYSGKTIEIIDTDAEGRMTMADAMAYLCDKYETKYVMNLATLTGSTFRTFGPHIGALMGNDDELKEHIMSLCQSTGEHLWPMPLSEVYRHNLDSDVADIKNYSGRPISGAIDAAKFMEEFVEHDHWTHFDIAGVLFGNVPGFKDKAATGWGLRLFWELLNDLHTRQS